MIGLLVPGKPRSAEAGGVPEKGLRGGLCRPSAEAPLGQYQMAIDSAGISNGDRAQKRGMARQAGRSTRFRLDGARQQSLQGPCEGLAAL